MWHPPASVATDSPTALPKDALTSTAPKALRVCFLAQLHTMSPKLSGKYARISAGIKNGLSKNLERCTMFLLDKWCTWTVKHWSLYLPTATLTTIINYYPGHMVLFEPYKSPSTPPLWIKQVISNVTWIDRYTSVNSSINHSRRSKRSNTFSKDQNDSSWDRRH